MKATNNEKTLNIKEVLRVVRKSDGYYVVGRNMQIPVDDYEDGKEFIEYLNKQKK